MRTFGHAQMAGWLWVRDVYVSNLTTEPVLFSFLFKNIITEVLTFHGGVMCAHQNAHMLIS